ncbi:hypothetical protein A6B39_03575 [Mannheimia granulomatis]|uniref:Slam-dependent surface lipoprotein n=1 Tax=Mannheimia granulomatis TaxID=85402 RepID=UPI00159D1FCE|nr:Slam-dependent surface lipoprotein [Mannheimia granulomatis]QLB14597.1 hypothetical protein A6B39_03575 [Mannheimia granulomatis]
MENITKIGVTALACLIISACGSGGSSNADNPSNNGHINQASIPTEKDNSTGRVLVFDEKVHKKALTSATDLNVIIVDGQSIPIAKKPADTWQDDERLHTCCGKYTDVRFGLKESSGPSEKDYFFYNGNPTSNMPTSGTAHYTGHSFIDFDDEVYPEVQTKLNVKKWEDDYIKGTATFDVDFASKKLSGTLHEARIEPISVRATINGNSFNGSATSKDFNTTAELEGKFYGENAKELGGLFFDNKNSWGGTFGASK